MLQRKPEPRLKRFARTLDKYWSIMAVQLANSLAYPGEFIGRSLMIVPFMFIFAQLWKVTFAASGKDVISGLTLVDTMWYVMMTETIELSRPRLSFMISDSVKDGSIAYVLNRPYHFLLYHFSASFGDTVLSAIINALIGGVVVWLIIGPPPAAAGFLYVIPALLGAWVLNFFVTVMLGLAAFVTEDISAFQWIMQKFSFILGGLIIPLDFYPGWLQAITRALPFAAMSYAPARLFVSPGPALLWNTLALQLAWIVGLGLLTALAYYRGVRALTLNGG